MAMAMDAWFIDRTLALRSRVNIAIEIDFSFFYWQQFSFLFFPTLILK